MKRRCVCFIMIVIFAFSCTFSCFATTNTQASDEITTFISEDGTITRILDRENRVSTFNLGENNFSQLKADLLSLGWSENSIDNLTSEQLISMNSSKEIRTVTQYSVVDENGNVTYLGEQQALEEAARINAESQSLTPDFQTDNTAYSVKVVFSVFDLDEERFGFATDATWLTTPSFRGKDSIGGCAQLITAEQDSRSGYFEATVVRTVAATGTLVSEFEYKDTFGENDFKEAVNGTYNGAGAVFDLPQDTIFDGVYLDSYYDMHAYFYYEGLVNLPEQTLNFNASGTYTHLTVGIAVNPELSISLDGVAPSIGISAVALKNKTTATLTGRYEP